MFASYHIYPYYPDFLNYEENYLNYKDSEGKNNNYEAYLKELRAVHDMPVLVAEFGVPSSRGLTHVNPFGMNQGKHSEQEQGEIDTKLFQSIVKENYAGGLVFTWQDEWFKRTWNTMDYDNPDRRPYWNNMQTNEQHFGLLSFDPGVTPFYPDGLTGDWELNQTKPFYETKDRNSLLQKMFVASDSGYLYIRLDYSKAVDWQKNPTYLLFDTIRGQGQRTIQLDQLKLTTNFETDFVAELSGPKESRIMVDSYYDSFYYQYGELLNMIPRLSYASKKDNGIFHPIRLALNKEFTIPSTMKKYPFQSYETGKLEVGNGNPASKEFNSLTDISMSKDQKTIEIRLPWQLINVKDPSEKEAMGDLWKNGMEASVKLDGIKIAAVMANKDYVTASLPDSNKSAAVMPSIKTYEWTTWNEPAYTERLKKSYYMIQQVFHDTTLENEGEKDKE